MKKLIAIITVIAIAMSFTACSNVSANLDSVKNVFNSVEEITSGIKENSDRVNEVGDKILDQVEKNLEAQEKAEEEINKLAGDILGEVEEGLDDRANADKIDELTDKVVDQLEEELKEQEKPSNKLGQFKNELFNKKDQHFRNDTVDGRFSYDTISVFPKEAYYQNGTLVLTCFVVNGYSTTATGVHVKSISVKGDNDHLIAEAFFDAQQLTIAPLSYVTHTFYFSGDTLADADADLSHLIVDYRFSAYH